MSENIKPPSPIIGLLRDEDLIGVLIKHNNLHEGLYVLSVEMRIAIGAVGPNAESLIPGAIVGVSGVGLTKVETPTVGIKYIDAALFNPKAKPRKKLG